MDGQGYVAMQVAALAAVAGRRACPWPGPEHYQWGQPWATAAGRYESVQVLLATSRERFLAAWQGLDPADQQALRDDGVFGAPPPRSPGAGDPAPIRFRVLPAGGFADLATGQEITPGEVAAYCAARHAGRPFVSQLTSGHAGGGDPDQLARPVFGQRAPREPRRRTGRNAPASLTT